MYKNIIRVFVMFLLIFSLDIYAGGKPKIYLIGDSIVASYPSTDLPLAGWGQVLPNFFCDNVLIINKAAGGASSKTYRTSHLWKKLLSLLKKGDYVMIQFGHNDKYPLLKDKYSDPDTTYKSNLKYFVNSIRKIGAFPILVTPPVRMSLYSSQAGWRNSHIQSRYKFPEEVRRTDTSYPQAMRDVAKKEKVILIDLNKRSHDFLTSIKDFEEIASYYRYCAPGKYPNYPNGSKDLEHFSLKGATLLAKFIAEELQKQNVELKKYLRSFSANAKETKKRLRGNKTIKRFNLGENDFKYWRSSDPEIILKYGHEKNTPVMTLNIFIDHARGKNKKFLVGWPRIYRYFHKSTINLTDFDIIAFQTKVESATEQQKSFPATFSIAAYSKAKCLYNINIIKENDSWFNVKIPIKAIIDKSKYNSDFWKDVKVIQLVFPEGKYENKTRFKVKIRKLYLLKLQN